VSLGGGEGGEIPPKGLITGGGAKPVCNGVSAFCLGVPPRVLDLGAPVEAGGVWGIGLWGGTRPPQPLGWGVLQGVINHKGNQMHHGWVYLTRVGGVVSWVLVPKTLGFGGVERL